MSGTKKRFYVSAYANEAGWDYYADHVPLPDNIKTSRSNDITSDDFKWSDVSSEKPMIHADLIAFSEYEKLQDQLTTAQNALKELLGHHPEHHKEWSPEKGDQCKKDCPRCSILKTIKKGTENG